jgi:polar amino acid transport system substrate-binding protein
MPDEGWHKTLLRAAGVIYEKLVPNMLMTAAATMARLIGFRALSMAIAAAWALGGQASTAAPLELVTDQHTHRARASLPSEHLSDDEVPGFATEVLRRVFAVMGQEASFEEFPWSRALKMVFRGERDAAYPALYTNERARFCYFPEEPLLASVKWVFFVRAADTERLRFSSFDNLAGHDIALRGALLGGLRDTAVSPELGNFVRQHRNFIETDTAEAAFRMLEAGRVDYAVATVEQGTRLIGSMGLYGKVEPLSSRSLNEAGMYIIFSKARVSPSFVNAFSHALKQFKQTEEFQEMYRTFH